MDYKHKVIDPMAGQLKSLFEQQGIDVYDGTGVIKNEHTVEVNGQPLDQSLYVYNPLSLTNLL
jgi:glutathione reductase (NADPH)